MKTKIILLLGVLALATLCTARPAEEEYEYEEEPAPPPKKVPARPLVGRRTNPLAGKSTKASSTTTTTTAAPQEEEEVPAEGDYEDEQPVETSSTTETTKKYIRPIIRPFRSNNDLLESLKKRREQVVNTKQSKPITSPSEPKEEVASSEPVQKETKPAASSGRRNRFSKGKASSNDVAAVADPETSSSAAPARTARGRFSSRS